MPRRTTFTEAGAKRIVGAVRTVETWQGVAGSQAGRRATFTGPEWQILKIEAAASGGAKYDARVFDLDSDGRRATGDLDDDSVEGKEYGADGALALFFNLAEADGTSTHTLTDAGNELSPYVMGRFCGMTSEDPKRRLYVGWSLAVSTCSESPSSTPTYSADREITEDPDSITLTDRLVYSALSGSALYLPDATAYGRGREVVVVNTSSGTISLASSGSDTLAGAGVTGSNVDIAAAATGRITAISGGWLVTGNV